MLKQCYARVVITLAGGAIMMRGGASHAAQTMAHATPGKALCYIFAGLAGVMALLLYVVYAVLFTGSAIGSVVDVAGAAANREAQAFVPCPSWLRQSFSRAPLCAGYDQAQWQSSAAATLVQDNKAES